MNYEFRNASPYPSSAAAPWGFQNGFSVFVGGFLNLLHCMAKSGFACKMTVQGKLFVQFLQQRHGRLSVGELPDVLKPLRRWQKRLLYASLPQLMANGRTPPPRQDVCVVRQTELVLTIPDDVAILRPPLGQPPQLAPHLLNLRRRRIAWLPIRQGHVVLWVEDKEIRVH